MPWPDLGPSTEVAGFCERPKIGRSMTMPKLIGGSPREREVVANTVRLCHRYTWYAVMMLDHIASEIDRRDFTRARCLWAENQYKPTFVYQGGSQYQGGRPCLEYYFGPYSQARVLKLRTWFWNLLRYIEGGHYAISIGASPCPCSTSSICIRYGPPDVIHYCNGIHPNATPIWIFHSMLHELYHGVGGKHNATCDGKVVHEYAIGDEGLHELAQKCPDLAIINPYSAASFCQGVGLAVDGNVGGPPCDGHRYPGAVPQPFYWGKSCPKNPPQKKPDPRTTLRVNPRGLRARLASFFGAFFGHP